MPPAVAQIARLGRGEFGVQLNLGQDDEFGELGTFFNEVSEQLSADRTQMAGQVANLESAVEQLEDAVAIVNARGELLFANPAMRSLLPGSSPGASLDAVLPADHPLRRIRAMTDAALQALWGDLDGLYAAGGRPSIAPEKGRIVRNQAARRRTSRRRVQ